MSKYPCKYVSGSKKAELAIEDMATPHLCNAWRKLTASGYEGDTFAVAKCMEEELKSRGGTHDPETGQWVFEVTA